MSVYRIPATKDSTLISQSLFANAGQSEILLIGTRRRFEDIGTNADTGSICRAVIKFGETPISTSFAEITNLINNEYISSSECVTASLKIFHAYSDDYASTYNFEINPLSQQWDEGDGFDLEPTEISGDSGSCCWTQSDSSTYWTLPGGATQSDYLAQVTHSTGDEDIEVDITTTVKAWVDGTFANYGLLVKANNEEVTTGSRFKRVYSRNTNTPYEPVIEVKWDDRIRDDRVGILNNTSDNKLYLYYKQRGQLIDIPGITKGNDTLYVKITQTTTSSAAIITDLSASWKRKGIYETDAINISGSTTSSVYDHWYSGSTLLSSGTCSVATSSMNTYLSPIYDYFVITIPNLQEEYDKGDVKNIEVFARDRYPTYTYSTSSIIEQQTQTLYNASFSISDYETDERLIDYSKFTAISYNSDMNWFRFFFTGLPLNRPLYFSIKYEKDGTERYEKYLKTFVIRNKE